VQALVLERPGEMLSRELAAPPAPGPGEALVRSLCVGVCGTDLHAYHGRQPFFSYPRILGHELAVAGHVIMLEHATTGDGTLTALHLLSRVASTGSSLAGLAAVMERLPQVLVNVKGVDKSGVDVCEPLQAAVREVEAELGVTGRVLLRPSGTEPVVRVMVEAPDAAQAQQVADRLAEVVLAELSLEG
jgi:phosphomannomutase